MAMGRRKNHARTPGLWITTNELPPTGGHPFYQRLNQVLDAHAFDEFVEAQCAPFYAGTVGRPSLMPGTYFRLLLIGYFEGIDSERGIAWRTADSLALRGFLGLGLDEVPPEHSTISRTRRLIDLETGAIVGVTVQGADHGDTTTIAETVMAAAEELEAVATVTDEHTAVIDEVVADKGYHSNQVLVDLAALDLRTYIAEPDRGRRNWKKKAAARTAVYANRRRIRGTRGRALQRRRSERLERPNAHLYETGALRRTHLRGHANILKRLLVHIGGFNLGLLMRTLVGVGTPRGLQGRLAAIVALIVALSTHVLDRWREVSAPAVDGPPHVTPHHRFELLPVSISGALLTTGC